MSDAAFKTGKYPAYTTNQLREFVTAGQGNDVMFAEIARREKVAAGDWDAMTDGERLRHAQTTGRTRAGNNIC
jgi:hypothetical protein